MVRPSRKAVRPINKLDKFYLVMSNRGLTSVDDHKFYLVMKTEETKLKFNETNKIKLFFKQN